MWKYKKPPPPAAPSTSGGVWFPGMGTGMVPDLMTQDMSGDTEMSGVLTDPRFSDLFNISHHETWKVLKGQAKPLTESVSPKQRALTQPI